MDYLLLGRVAKLVALLGFFLPWVTVSCSGTEILEATGWQLMTGDIEPTGPLAGADTGQDKPEPSPLVIAAFVAIALGLLAALLTKARIAAAALLIGGVCGAGLSYYSVQNMRAEMTHQMEEAQNKGGGADTGGLFSAEQQNDMTRAMASAIRVEEQEGFWLTVAAAGVAAILGLIVLAGAGARVRDGDAPA